MNSETYIVAAALAFFVLAVVLVQAAFGRIDSTGAEARHSRKQAEEDQRILGGWFIYRDGTAYRVPNDQEFIQYCRDGRISPYDEVYVGTERTWKWAMAVPLAGLVFPAFAIPTGAPRTQKPSGWALFLMLAWSSAAVNDLREIISRSIGSTVADVVVSGFLVIALMYVWRHIRRSALLPEASAA